MQIASMNDPVVGREAVSHMPKAHANILCQKQLSGVTNDIDATMPDAGAQMMAVQKFERARMESKINRHCILSCSKRRSLTYRPTSQGTVDLGEYCMFVGQPLPLWRKHRLEEVMRIPTDREEHYALKKP